MYLSSLFCSLISLSLFSIILPSDLLPDVVPQCQGGNGRCLIRVLEAVLTSGGVYHILSTSPDFGPRACSVVSLPACRASLDNSLSLFHASSPFLDCRKLGGASKLLPQVCVTLSCVESILHLSTPQRPKACCEAAHFPRAGTGVSRAPSPSGWGGLWHLEAFLGSSGGAAQVSSTLAPSHHIG